MSEIKQSLNDFITAHPKLKFMFFGAKGGVGKTVMAGVTAMHFAQQGRRAIQQMGALQTGQDSKNLRKSI